MSIKKKTTKQLKIGNDFYFDPNYNQVFSNNIPIKLSRRELQLLKILINARGNIVAFADIEYAIWDEHVTNNALRILIFRLRKKLEYNVIETFPSFGCRLIIDDK